MRLRPLTLRTTGWLVRIGVGVVPTLVLLKMSGDALLVRVDALLGQAKPIAVAEASRLLGRPVQIGTLAFGPASHNRAADSTLIQIYDRLFGPPTSAPETGLTTQKLITWLSDPGHYGALPITAEDIYLGNKPEEVRFAGGTQLARVERVTAFVSLPTLLSGKFTQSVSQLLVENADAVVVRFPDGKLNITQIVPKPKPGTKPSPPFQTIVRIERARLRFRDYASKIPALAASGQPAINDFQLPQSVVDLGGTRLIRFTTTVLPQAGTATAKHLDGQLFVSGTARRTQPTGELYVAPDGPSDNAPLFLVRLQASGADIPYWYYYFVQQERTFTVRKGRADLSVTLAAARPPVNNVVNNPNALLQSLSVSLSARIDDAAIGLPNLRQPVTDINGTVDYQDGALQFDARAAVLGEQLAASGSLWNLPSLADAAKKGRALPRPNVAATFDVSRIPLARVVRELLPNNITLPAGLQLSGVASARGTFSGQLTGRPQDISLVTAVQGINVAYAGAPEVRNLGAQVAFSGTTARISNLSARLAGGGIISAQGDARFTADFKRAANASFSGRVQNVNLAALTRLRLPNQARPVIPANDPRLRLTGLGNVVLSGQLVDGSLSGAANVTTSGLALGDIPFPVAQGRILVQNNQITVPSLRIESPIGRAVVEGDVLPLPTLPGVPGSGQPAPARLGLRFGFSALDLARLGRALRVPGLGGMVSGAGTVSGSLADPQVVVSSLVALNLRAQAPAPAQQGNGPKKTVQLALDSIVADGLRVSRRQVQLTRPVVLRRFPASVTITGNVDNLLPTDGGKPNPLFALSATVRNLDYAEAQRQTGLNSAVAARAVNESLNKLRVAAGATPAPAPDDSDSQFAIDGSITQAVVRVRGSLSDPRVVGSASAGNILVGRYPLEGASLDFDYNRQRTLVRNLQVKASVGQVTGNAVVRANGGLSGSFAALGLDIERLSFLTNSTIPIGGAVDIRGELSGTVRRPLVTASVTAPRVRIGETILEGVTAEGIRFAGGDSGSGIVELPRFALRSSGANLEITRSRYNLQTREFATVVSLTDGNVGTLLDTVRRSGLSQTADGARIVQALGRLPQPLEGRFDIPRLTIQGRITPEGQIDPQVSGTIAVRDLLIGTFKTETVSIDAALNGKVVTVRSFTATQPGATIRGGGTYDPEGQVNAFIETNEANLDILRTIPGLNGFPVYGTLEDFSVRVTGPSNKPRVRASVQGRNLLVVTPTDEAALPTKTVVATVQAQANANDTRPNDTATVPVDPSAVAAEPLKGYLISLARLEGEIAPDEQGNDRIFIPDAYVRAGNAEVRASASIPIAYNLTADEPFRLVTDRDLSVRVAVPSIDLENFLQTLRPTTQPGTVQTVSTPATPPVAQAVAKSAKPAKRGGKGKVADEAASAAQPKLEGTAEALVEVTGSLNEPALSGFMRVTDGKFQAPRPTGGQEQISSINDFDANLRFETTGTEGSRVVFDQFLLTLGGINGEKGNKGTLDVGGSIRIDTLEDLQRLIRQGGSAAVNQANSLNLRGSYNLLATLNEFRPVVNNFFGLQEFAQGQADGKVAITGPLLTPKIASADGPIRITKATVRPPVKEGDLGAAGGNKAFNPSFDIALTIPDKATLTNQTLFRFEAQGDARITGKLYSQTLDTTGLPNRPNRPADTGTDVGVRADLEVIGGFVQFPTAYLKVQRGGTVQFRYGTVNPGIRVEDVVAKGTIRVAAGARIAGYDPNNPNNVVNTSSAFSQNQVLSQSAAATQRYDRYDITANVNGSLDILNGGSPIRNRNGSGPQQKNPISLSSNPPLPESAIYSLLLTQQQAELIGQGRFSDAFSQFGQQALTSSILPRFISPLTGGIASAFGLEDFSLDYDFNPDAPVRVRIVKRLPDPFDRFLIDATRAFQTRNTPGQLQPYQFNFSYELYQFKSSRSILPRLQVGYSTDEQRTNTFFLRGSVSY